MISARLDPCVAPPVAESLAATGSDGPLLTIAVIGAIVLVAAGAIAMFTAKTLRGKIAAFVLPAVLLGSLAFNTPAPAFATTGAPTVTTEAVVVSVWDAPLVKYTVTEVTAATFRNPEGCVSCLISGRSRR